MGKWDGLGVFYLLLLVITIENEVPLIASSIVYCLSFDCKASISEADSHEIFTSNHCFNDCLYIFEYAEVCFLQYLDFSF